MSQILFIEPDRTLAKAYGSALKRAGHTVKHFVDAALAMQAADTNRPDLLIIELQLARHNGVDFLYEFRSYREWQTIPVVILSIVPPHEAGMGDSIWQQLGVAAYCYKPHTSLASLVTTVHEALITPVSS